MSKNLLFLITTILLVPLINSATLYCGVSAPNDVRCVFPNITEVTQPNEPITFYGQPSTYVDSYSPLLWFTGSYIIRYIPTQIFTIFPNLDHFMIDNCSFTYLVTDAFTNCPLLTRIDITRANFINIPAAFAQSCSKLGTVSFISNNIETIDENALMGLDSLTAIALGANKITCLPKGLFQHTPLIQSVLLDSNSITAIDPLTFKGLKNFQYATYENNSLQILPLLDLNDTGIWAGFNFQFKINPIYAIHPDFFKVFQTRPSNVSDSFYIYTISCRQNSYVPYVDTTNYQTLGPLFQSCFSNWTSSMNYVYGCGEMTTTSTTTTTTTTTLAPVTNPSGTCQSDRICRYFLDQFNRYTCVIDGVDSVLTSIGGSHLVTFDDLSVRRVIFTNSFLSRIPPILFQKFSNLEYLTVSGCSMSTINTKTFTTCGNLRYLDASFNDIINVDGASFKNCTKIEVVDLTGNKISYVDAQLLVNNPTMKNIYINRPPSMILI